MCELAPPAMGAAAPEDAELPTITWSEYQRRVEEGAEQLILVAGAIIDVAELQEGEHKGGAVYNFGADMTNMFGGAHAHPPDRYSLHEPELRVVENVLKKVRRWTVALLDESTRPTDPSKIRIDLDGVPGYSQASEHKDLATTSADIGGGVPLVAAEHPWWEPSQAKVGTTAEASSSLAAQGLDVTTELGHACAGLAPGSVGARAFAAVMGLLRRRCGRDTVPLELRAPFAAALRAAGSLDTPEFVSPTLNAFYSVPLGNRSCYGDQAFVLMQHLVAHGGVLEPSELSHELEAAFRPESEGGSLGYGELEGTNGLTNKEMPIDGPWRHGSMKGFLERMALGKHWPQCGSDDAQADCLTKVVPLVAACAGRSTLAEDVEDAIRVTQDSDDAVLYGGAFARLLEAAILRGGGSSSDKGGSVEALASTLLGEGDADERQVGKELMSAARLAASCLVDASRGCSTVDRVSEALLELAGGRPLPGLT